jgi:hypothetical protein
MKHIHLPCLFLALSTVGCGVGGLGQVALHTNSAQDDRGIALDHPLAVGARWSPTVETKLRGAGAPAAHLEAADSNILSAEGGTLTGRTPGMSAVLITTDDGTVLDFVHVWVKAPTGIDLHATAAQGRRRLQGPIELFVDEVLELDAEALAEGQPLAGDLDLDWRTEGASIDVMVTGDPSRRRLVAVGPGKTRLTVSRACGPETSGCRSGDVFTTLDVSVRQRPGSGPKTSKGGTL